MCKRTEREKERDCFLLLTACWPEFFAGNSSSNIKDNLSSFQNYSEMSIIR
jgi:hypothetical protein